MELYIAGGCGEHGRNCFYVQGDPLCFLVDCGTMAGTQGDPDPRLSREQIERIDAVFLTHSHADHTGALGRLIERGYSGPIVATNETLRQLPKKYPNTVSLEEICADGRGEFRGMSVTWGRSGHCAGSVWYRFEENGKSVLFSGDYTEKSQVYPCDFIRSQTADMAVLDCAYGTDETAFETYRERILGRTKELAEGSGLIVFPVPKYGRGLDLFRLLSGELRIPFYGDSLFLQNLDAVRRHGFWYAPLRSDVPVCPYRNERHGIVFVSDPQLRSEEARKTVASVLSAGGKAIMTGTAEHGSFSEMLLEKKEMEMIRFPVHLNHRQYEKLISENRFSKAIPYHTPEISCESHCVF
ncbi:MAG: MBL fold metallo-hydrolase [Clostridia bacterium]|nr:MBL fold metallo-hydrolase [Clostridia bacterium]